MSPTAQAVASPYGKSAVKASLFHFLLGKALNAAVSFITLIALARWLEPTDYGVYIAFIALQASLLAVSNLGIDTTAERFMPELRMRHPDTALLGFVAAVLCARVATLFCLVGIAWLLADDVTALVGLKAYSALFRLWLGVVGLTGLLGLVVVLLEAMLHQKQAQMCLSAYVVLKLSFMCIGWQLSTIDIRLMVPIELLATGAAALFGAGLLLSHFSRVGLHTGWSIVKENRQRLQRFAFFNYVAQVVFQLFNAEMMKLMVTRLLGVLQAAVYGFAYSLADTVQRYLPAVLLLRLIKPVFVSRYAKTGDFQQLNAMARLILKLNLLVLTPAIAFAAVYGGNFLALMSGGRYADAHWLLVGILCLMVLTSHQLVLSLLAGTLEKNAMQLYAGLVSIVAFPCALLLVPLWGPLGAVVASAIGGLTYNVFATLYLRRAGFAYQPEVRGGGVFAIGGVMAFAVAFLANQMLSMLPGLITAALVGTATYVLCVRGLSAFNDSERDLLNSLLPKRVFFF